MTLSSYKRDKETLDEALDAYCTKLIETIHSQSGVEYVRDSVEYLKNLVMGGGKRIRGHVLMQMYATAGGTDTEVIMAPAVGIELFHLFALVHDDVMDKAAARRGITTMHHYTEGWLHEQQRCGDLAHVGQSQAILWGDFLLGLAQLQFQTAKVSPAYSERALLIYNRMLSEVVIGQMIDMDLTTRTEVKADDIMEKTLLKTALYTYVRPMQIGAAYAGASEEYFTFADSFGRNLGVAFQLQDDLFDVTLNEVEMGKPVLNDVKSGEHTLLSSYVFEHGSQDQQAMLRRVFGMSMTEAETSEIRQLFKDTGAVAYAEAEISRYLQEAERATQMLAESKRQPWLELVEVIKRRRA